MAPRRDGRISAMMHGVARSIGTEVQDLVQLERRRRQAEKMLNLGAPGAFAKLLDEHRETAAAADPPAGKRRGGHQRQGDQAAQGQLPGDHEAGQRAGAIYPAGERASTLDPASDSTGEHREMNAEAAGEIVASAQAADNAAGGVQPAVPAGPPAKRRSHVPRGRQRFIRG